MLFRRANFLLKTFRWQFCAFPIGTSSFIASAHNQSQPSSSSNSLPPKPKLQQIPETYQNASSKTLDEEEEEDRENLIEIRKAFVDMINNSKNTKRIYAILPYLHSGSQLDDQIRGKKLKNPQEIALHFVKMNAWNSIKYTFFGYDAYSSGIIWKESKIVLIRRIYWRRGGQYRIFSNFAYFWREAWRRMADPIGSRQRRRENLMLNTQFTDEFVGIHVNAEDGLVDHIVMRNIFQSDYDFVKKLQIEEEKQKEDENQKMSSTAKNC